MPSSRYATDEYYRQLHDVMWQKKPGVIKKPLKASLATEEEIFEAYVHLGEAMRRGEHDSNEWPNLFVDRRLCQADFLDLMPIAADRSLDGYFQRVDGLLGDRHLQIHADHDSFQPHAMELCLRVRDLLRPSWEKYGIPPAASGISSFIGRYDRTAQGIHIAGIDTFLVVVRGKKRMVVWPRDAFRDRDGKPYEGLFIQLKTCNLEPYLDKATVIEAEPGDIIYWPKEYWHIALGKTLAGPFTGLTVECWHSEGRLQGGTSLPAPRSDFLEGAK